MNYKHILVLVGVMLAMASTFIPSTASAQRCLYHKVIRDGNGQVVEEICANTPKQMSVVTGVIGVQDPDRSVSTHSSPTGAGSTVSAAQRWVTTNGGGYYQQAPPRPSDQRTARQLRDSILTGIQVTSFEDALSGAVDRGIRDGQHEQLMEAIRQLTEQLDDINQRLRGVAASNTALRRQLEADRARLERELRQAKVAARQARTQPPPTKAPPAKDGSSDAKSEPKKVVPPSGVNPWMTGTVKKK